MRVSALSIGSAPEIAPQPEAGRGAIPTGEAFGAVLEQSLQPNQGCATDSPEEEDSPESDSGTHSDRRQDPLSEALSPAREASEQVFITAVEEAQASGAEPPSELGTFDHSAQPAPAETPLGRAAAAPEATISPSTEPAAAGGTAAAAMDPFRGTPWDRSGSQRRADPSTGSAADDLVPSREALFEADPGPEMQGEGSGTTRELRAPAEPAVSRASCAQETPRGNSLRATADSRAAASQTPAGDPTCETVSESDLPAGPATAFDRSSGVRAQIISRVSFDAASPRGGGVGGDSDRAGGGEAAGRDRLELRGDAPRSGPEQPVDATSAGARRFGGISAEGMRIAGPAPLHEIETATHGFESRPALQAPAAAAPAGHPPVGTLGRDAAEEPHAAPPPIPASVVVGSRTGLPSWAERIQGALERAGFPARTELRIALEPEGLGHLDVRLRLQSGALHAQIVTDHEHTRGLLVQQQPSLEAALQRSALRLFQLDVDVRGEGQRQDPHFTDGTEAPLGWLAEPETASEAPALQALPERRAGVRLSVHA